MNLEKDLFNLDYWNVFTDGEEIYVPGTIVFKNKLKKHFYELCKEELEELSYAILKAIDKIKKGYFKDMEESYNIAITNNFRDWKYYVPFRRIEIYKNVQEKECIICHLSKIGKIGKYEHSQELFSYIVDCDEDFLTILNIFPYSLGNVMITPRSHIKNFSEFDYKKIYKLLEKSKEWLCLLYELFYKKGKPIYSIYANVGPNSGRSIEHIHLQLTIFGKEQMNNFSFDWIYNDRNVYLDKIFEAITRREKMKKLSGMNWLEDMISRNREKIIIIPRYRTLAGLEITKIYPFNETKEETRKKFTDY
ncbi:MAG: HIT domain-containing protein [Candidatus Aenigmarchaeota archaeon]|nr:HIT domain-containing protein [Candidatus Aenigmarchaeota archaeon]MDW8149590.1 HIT domain-containing protein [Candidatus Aenigmarchaeota archaeon]